MPIPLMLLWLAFFSACPATTKTSDTHPVSPDKELICFVYHRFGDARFPTTNVSLADFEAHLRYLKAHEFQVLTFQEGIDYLESDDPARKTAVITVDDGYESFFEAGLPLLEKYGFPATLFINTETVGGRDYMDWGALKDAATRNIEIGNHTHSHDYFLNLPADTRYVTFKEELDLSQKLIEENLGLTPKTFAYPYGELDEQMIALVKSAGFRAAAAQNSGVIYAGTDVMKCPRFPMSEYYAAPEKFAEKARMKALRVLSETPATFLVPKNDVTPELVIEFDAGDLIMDRLQCFVQGGDCKTEVAADTSGRVRVTLESTSSIANRRRTLYTVTVPDVEGRWHWFSHLWINSSVK